MGQLQLKPWTLEDLKKAVGAEHWQEILELGLEDPHCTGTSKGNRHLPWSPLSLCAKYATSRKLADYHLAAVRIIERAWEGKVSWSVSPAKAARRHEEDPSPSEEQGDGT